MSATAVAGEAAPLARDEEAWARARERTRAALALAARGIADTLPQVFAVVSAAQRSGADGAQELVALVRRIYVRAGPESDTGLRCLRLLSRVGGPVDVGLLSQALTGLGRTPRLALAALGEAAGREQAGALEVLSGALKGALRADAAFVLGHVGSESALDVLSAQLRTPGMAGLHAASALMAMDDDALAFESLCERLCDASEAPAAARALAGAAPDARWLREAEALLSRWVRRGLGPRIDAGRRVAAAELTALGWMEDVEAMMRALSSIDDELVITGTRAAYTLGDTERARGAALRLLRRGPASASAGFSLLVQWAGMGDTRAATLVRHVLRSRPADVGRAVMFEALAGSTRGPLNAVVIEALAGKDEPAALEAARAIARLHEPPAIVPAIWM